MKLLLVTQYFWPETFIINEIMQKLAALGHSVTVLTGKPNYPEGKLFPGYEAHGTQREILSPGIEILRVPLRPRYKSRSRELLLNYASFVLNGLRYFPPLIKGREFDGILALQLSPVTSVIPAIFLKRKLKIPLIMWIQDLWPESLAATGHIRSRFILWMVGKLVRWIYRRCDLILVQSSAFIAHVKKAAPASRIEYYANSISVDNELTALRKRELRRISGTILPNKFNLVFAGNIGKAQDVETILAAALLLRNQPRFHLVFIGSGSMSDWLKENIERHHLKNITLAGRFSQNDMPHFYSQADALLVSLKREEIFALTVPTKIQSYLAAGKPIIAALEGEGARIVLEAQAGKVCMPENPDDLAQTIRKMMQLSAAQRNTLGKNGRKYFLGHFEMKRQVDRLLEILSEYQRNPQVRQTSS